MKKKLPPLARPGTFRTRAGSALIIVLCFVMLLTVVVFAMLSHSIFNGMISSASSNVNKADLYGHGAINQVIGDLRQEIVAGSTVAAVTPATGGPASIASPYVVNSANLYAGTIYRPSAVATAVPYNAGPSTYTTTIWNSTFPNLVKESCAGVAFYPSTANYNTATYPAPNRAAAVSTDSSLDPNKNLNSGSADGASINGRYVSVTRWNKPLLLPKTTVTFSGGTGGTGLTIADTGTTTLLVAQPTPVGTFVAPDWILTAADGSNPTTFPASPSTTIANPKSTSYVAGRYAYTIYNEGGLLDANVAGCPASNTATGWTTAATAILSRKGPSAFADLTQVPGIADVATKEGVASRAQKIVDSLVGWRNAATTQPTFSPFPTATFSYSSTPPSPVGLYFNYLLGLSSNFMATGNASVYNDSTTGQNVTDQVFSSRQQLITFLESDVSKNATEQAYLQDALMYLGTFSRTLNQPSYWPDPTRPTVLAGVYTGAAGLVGNSAYQLDNTANPPFKSIVVATSSPQWVRNDGTTSVVGEPLVKKRFALSRLAWLTCDGPIASSSGVLNTSDTNINAIVTYLEGADVGMTANFLQEGTPANIFKYFGLTWVAGPAGQGSPGGYWYYGDGPAAGGMNTLGSIPALNREPDFFELLLAGTNVGGIAKMLGTIGSSPFVDIQDTTVSAQIMQLGANIIDEANATQYPTHIVYPFALLSGVMQYRSAFGAMDLPYLNSVHNLRYIVQASSSATGTNTPTATATAIPASTPSNGLYSSAQGTAAFLLVPSVWNPYDANGPAPINIGGTTGSGGGALVAPTNLRIVVSSVVTDLNTTLGSVVPTGGSSGNSNSAWPGPASGEWTGASGLGSNPITIAPRDSCSTTTANAPNVTSVTTSTSPNGTVTNSTNYVEYPTSPTGVPAAGNPLGYSDTWTSESSTELDFSNVSSLYREPTALMRPSIPANSNLAMGSSNNIITTNSSWSSGVPEAGSGKSFVGFLGTTFPLCWTLPANSPATGYFIYTVNDLPDTAPETMSATGETVRLEYNAGTTASPVWIPYMEYCGAYNGNGNGQLFQYTHDFVPITEAGTTASPYELTPMSGNPSSTTTGNLWNGNRNGCINAESPGFAKTWDVRSQTWGFPIDTGPAPLFLDGNSGTVPTTDMIETMMPSVTSSNSEGSHSMGTTMVTQGVYEPSGGPIFGLYQLNFFGNGSTSTPNTEYYADADGTVRRAIGAYAGPLTGPAGNINGTVSWTWTGNTTVSLPLATTLSYTSGTASYNPSTYYTPSTNYTQSRPIMLHRPYRSVAELGYVFSNTPFKNIDFSTPESPYSALLDVFCINEDYRPDPVMAGRVDLNTKQAPVLQALLSGAYRDEEVNYDVLAGSSPSPNTPVLTGSASSEAVAISQALVTRTTVGSTNPMFTTSTVTNAKLSGPQPLSNIGDLVGRWINGTTVGTSTSPINGAASYDGFSADLSSNKGLYTQTGGTEATVSQTSPLPSGSFNIIRRFREATMRAFSDSTQAGTWNLMIDVVAQSGHYPANATGFSNFLVEGERRYWVHVAIDRSTGQIVDENIEPVNE